MAKTLDVERIRSAAVGQWRAIYHAVGIPAELLSNTEGPCPKCGGNTRFRVIDEAAGALFCSHCFESRNGDGFAGVAWWKDCDFPAAVKLVAEHLRIDDPYKEFSRQRKISAKAGKESARGKGAASPSRASQKPAASDLTKNLRWLPWSDLLAARWCQKKKPITIEALKRCGARMAKYRREWVVIALPVWGEKLKQAEPVGWVLYNVTGRNLPTYSKDKKGVASWVKVKTLSGSCPGIVGTVS